MLTISTKSGEKKQGMKINKLFHVNSGAQNNSSKMRKTRRLCYLLCGFHWVATQILRKLETRKMLALNAKWQLCHTWPVTGYGEDNCTNAPALTWPQSTLSSGLSQRYTFPLLAAPFVQGTNVNLLDSMLPGPMRPGGFSSPPTLVIACQACSGHPANMKWWPFHCQ